MELQNFVDEDFMEEDGSGDDINEEEHDKLLRVMHVMDNQNRIKPPARTEPSLDISEFHLPKIKDVGVHLKDLVRSLDAQGKAYGVDVANKIKALNKRKVLSKPLEKIEEQKVKRLVAYKNLSKRVGRWDAIVQTNRSARSVTFPMNIDALQPPSSSDVIANWQTQPPTELEDGINKLLGISQVAQVDKKEEEEFRLTLAELREKRGEMAKLRVQQSYEAAKAKRMKKIKSKKYHRIQRRAKMHKQLQDFEILQKTDPEAALQQMEKMEKVRAEERMTLRHKSSGHWARSRLGRAKYDPQTRMQLAEQLATSRELTRKLKVDSDEESDGGNNAVEDLAKMKMFSEDKDNPWITVEPKSEVKEFVSGYRRYWENENKNKNKKKEMEMAMRAEKPLNREVIADANFPPEKQSLLNLAEGENTRDKSCNYHQSTEAAVPSNSDNSSEDMNCFDAEECGSRYDGSVLGKEAAKQRKRTQSSPKIVKNKQCFLLTNTWEVTPVGEVTAADSQTNDKKETLNSNCDGKSCETLSGGETFLNAMKETTLCAFVTTDTKKKKKKKSALDKMFKEIENNISEKVEKKLDKLNVAIHCNDRIGGAKKTKKMNVKSDEDDLGASLALRNTRDLRPREDKELIEGSLDEGREHSTQMLALAAARSICVEPSSGKGSTAKRDESRSKPKEANINPDNFIVAKPKLLLSAAPDIVTAGEEALDDEYEEMRQTIVTEAFADDDVIDTFRKQKAEEEEKSKPVDVNLSLPGWGEWGGTGIVESKRKKRRFTVNAPPAPPRKDANKFNVIINEEVEKALREHKVCELPAPFTSVKDFETSIRAPVGNTWVPQTAHQKLIKPAVISKMGRIIKPMDEEFLVNKKVLMVNK